MKHEIIHETWDGKNAGLSVKLEDCKTWILRNSGGHSSRLIPGMPRCVREGRIGLERGGTGGPEEVKNMPLDLPHVFRLE